MGVVGWSVTPHVEKHHGLKIIILFHLEWRSGMSGAVPLFPRDVFMEWTGIGTNLLLCYFCNFTSYSREYGRYGEGVHTGFWKEILKERAILQT